jgi:branched-chain amino acid transport system permease protein
MAAQFITVDFIITQYVSQVGGRGTFFSLPPGSIRIGPWPIDSDVKVYYLMVVLVVLCTAGMANLLRTRVGRAWIAIRDNDIAAEAMGVNIVLYKLLAFFVAGVLGGIAGAFWISSLFFVSPEHFQFGWSLWIVGCVLIGGAGSLHGTIFGAMFITLVLEGLKFAVIPLSDVFPALQERFLYVKEAAFGLAIVLFLLYEPKGLAYRWQQIKNYFNLWPFSY